MARDGERAIGTYVHERTVELEGPHVVAVPLHCALVVVGPADLETHPLIPPAGFSFTTDTARDHLQCASS